MSRANAFIIVISLASWVLLPRGARAEAVHFDTPAEYEGQFNDNSNVPVFSWTAGSGVGATTGRIDVADDPRAIPVALYRRPFDLRGGVRHEVSSYFLTAFTNRSTGLGGVGFAPLPGGSFSGGQPWVAPVPPQRRAGPSITARNMDSSPPMSRT